MSILQINPTNDVVVQVRPVSDTDSTVLQMQTPVFDMQLTLAQGISGSPSGGAVASVAGKTGVVTLEPTDIVGLEDYVLSLSGGSGGSGGTGIADGGSF
jgi:hypothetical protein